MLSWPPHPALSRRLRPAVAGALWAILPAGAMAHPHVFVSANVDIVVEGGQVSGVRLQWDYDDFFSLVLTSDLGIDLDGDMILTPEEAEILAASVLAWPEDYTGDLELRQNGRVLPLAPKTEAGAVLIDGRVREHHLRPLDPPAATPVEIAVFDPYYYVAYEIATLPRVVDPQGNPVADCEVALVKADLEAAYAVVEEEWGRPADDFGPDEDFPMVGENFADRVIVTCAG